MHWATEYIGLPWHATAEGPHAFNCWTFVRYVQVKHYGRSLPAIPYNDNLLALAKSFRDHPERGRWREVERPDDGDCVLLRQARYPVHVGLWIGADGGGVLHCSRDSGVVFQRLDALHMNGWMVDGFYQFKGSVEGGGDAGA